VSRSAEKTQVEETVEMLRTRLAMGLRQAEIGELAEGEAAVAIARAFAAARRDRET
jgi:hypothetical protein